MRSLTLAALLLAVPAGAADKEQLCRDLTAEPPLAFDGGSSVVVDRVNWRLLFCRHDGVVAKIVELPDEELGQSTINPREGLAGIVYRGPKLKTPRLAIFDSSGRRIADLSMKAMNAVFWVEDGEILAGSPDDGVTRLSMNGKFLGRRGSSKKGAATAIATDGATAAERKLP